jgi:hypothetical protein
LVVISMSSGSWEVNVYNGSYRNLGSWIGLHLRKRCEVGWVSGKSSVEAGVFVVLVCV